MEFDGLDIEGYSLGGIETTVWLPRLKLAVDVGRGPGQLVRAERIALTHTHMDHAGGLAYLLALRQLYGMSAPTIFVPAQMADKLAAMLQAWDRLQRFESNYELVAVEPDQRYPLTRDTELRPFRTHHVVPSVGYELLQTTQKLKNEYRGMSGPELVALKGRGVEITQAQTRQLLAITGDTLIEALDKNPHVLDAETLLCECTFLDARKPYDKVRAGGHIHLTDLMERAERFKNRNLVLSHFSQMHSREEATQLLAPLAARIHPNLFLFPTQADEPWVGPLGRSDSGKATD